MILTLKKIVAFICNILGLSKLSFNRLNKKYNNNYVRVINYHNTEKEYINLFENHIKYLKETFRVLSFDEFKKFLNNEITLDKPGLLITFDDGYISNYEYGIDVLDKYEIEGTFFISSEKIDNKDDRYINKDQLKEMIHRGHKIGCHTASHHRFSEDDSIESLKHEIVDSNNNLNKTLGVSNDCFCFVGGELPVYTKQAFELIKDNYNYSFTTLTQVTTSATNPLMIHRTNVESFWNLGLVKFQVSGIWDILYRNKAKQVENKLLK